VAVLDFDPVRDRELEDEKEDPLRHRWTVGVNHE